MITTNDTLLSSAARLTSQPLCLFECHEPRKCQTSSGCQIRFIRRSVLPRFWVLLRRRFSCASLWPILHRNFSSFGEVWTVADQQSRCACIRLWFVRVHWASAGRSSAACSQKGLTSVTTRHRISSSTSKSGPNTRKEILTSAIGSSLTSNPPGPETETTEGPCPA